MRTVAAGPHVAKGIAVQVGVLGAYFAVAIVRTLPLIAKGGRSLPGSHTDAFSFAWNNWWIFHAIEQRLPKPYLTTHIFAPYPIDLRLHTAGFLYGLLSAPLFPWLGQVGVLNLQIFATIILNGYATFKLARYVIRDEPIAFACGFLIAATQAINFHLASGRPSSAALWPAILAAYFFLRLLDEPTIRNSAYLAVSAGAMFLMDQQIALFGCFWLAILALAAILRRARPLMRPRALWALVFPAVVVALASYLLYFRPLRYDLGYTVPGASEAINYSPGIDFFGNPKYLWITYGTVLPLGAVIALLSVRRLPDVRVWVLGAWAFLILTMGPVIHGTSIPLPFALVRHLPGLEHFRTPYRFQMPAAVGAAMALGVVLSHVRSRIGLRPFWLLLSAVLLVALGDLVGNRLVMGFPIRSVPPTETVYDLIAHDKRDCLVLEIPVAVRSGTDRIGRWTETPGEALTFYQATHHKRLINGFVARVPVAAMEYYRASPALMFLAEETPPPGNLVDDLKRKLIELDVGYVVIHPEMLQPGRLLAVLQLLDQTEGLERMPNTGGLIAFRRDTAQ